MLNYTQFETPRGSAAPLEQRPIYTQQPQYAPQQASVREYSFFSISNLFGILFSYFKSIAAITLGITLFLVILSKLITPKYVATAQIYIDPKGLQVFENELTNNKNQDSNAAINLIESQIRVITSSSVLDKVVEKEKLYQDEEFFLAKTPSEGGSFLDGLFPKTTSLKPRNENEGKIRAKNALFKKITIKRPERTFIVDISMESKDAEKAAVLANSIAKSYIDEQTNEKSEAARKTTALLTSRLDDLRNKVKTAEEAAEVYKSKNNIVGVRGTLVNEQSLSDVNMQLSTARARLSDAQGRFEQVQRAKATGADLGSISEAINSSTISTYRTQQADARRKLSELNIEYGSKHPSVRNAQAQVDDINRQINEELARIMEGLRYDVERAKSSEVALAQSFDKLKVTASDSSQATVQLRELERESEAARTLYNSFLIRSRETGELERIDTSNTQIISPATMPYEKKFPPGTILMTLIGLILGGMIGYGQAFARALVKAG
jgi:polysaccharide biosynthesis transport protein